MKRESNARTKANQTLEQNGQCKRQKRESRARKSACKATAAPAQSSSSTNDTNSIIPLSLNRSDNILLDLAMVPRSVSVPKACVYPFNSSRLQRHTLGKMDTPYFSCGALKWLDERVRESTKCSPVFATCCAWGKVLLPYL